MVGKSPAKTKPYIMMVSDDKQRLKAAFKLIKSQKSWQNTRVELGHGSSVAVEFEDLQQLGEGHGDMHDPVSDSKESEKPVENALIANDYQFLLSSLISCTTRPLSPARPTKIGFHTPSGDR